MADHPLTAPSAAGRRDGGPHRPEEAALLTEIGQLFNSRLQIEEILARMARLIAEWLSGECIVFLGDSGQAPLRARTWYSSEAARMEAIGRVLAGREFPRGADVEALSAHTLRDDCEAEAAERLHELWRELGVTSLVVAPIVHGSERLGLIAVARTQERAPFEPADREFLAALAPQVAGAIINARALAEERWQRQKAELMFQASKAVHTELHFDQAVREISLLLKQSIKTPWVGLLEYQPQEESLQLLGSTAEPAVDLRLGSQRFSLQDWPEAAEALADTEVELPIPLPEALASAIGQPHGHAWSLPLLHKQMPQGLLLLLAPPGPAIFAPESREVAVGIAELVALAIANQHLIDQEARARIQIIRSQAAAQEREVLLRQIVHDLRNATQAMSLVVEDMELAAGENPQLQAGISTINNQITFISNFLKEKLTWIQPGERSNPDQVTVLAAVFADLEGRFGPVARAKNQRLIVSLPEPIKVNLSAVQLEQIIGNLLDNGIKYTQHHGEVRLWADVSDGWVTIYVADNGPGIPPADQPRLGEVGYRGQQSQPGSGLGLANVRQLVTRAGGLFGFSSHDGSGTTFHVSLPTTTWGRVIS